MSRQKKNQNHDRPNVWVYRDARQFTKDQVAWLQQNDPKLSFRRISQRANLGSPNYVQQFVAGVRNIKRDTARTLARALELNDREQLFFEVLVRFTQSAGKGDQLAVYQDLLRLADRSGAVSQLDYSRMRYFTEWYVPVIHAMASLKDFRADPAWIAGRIVPSIRPSEAANALEILLELGIFKKTEAGKIVVAERQLETEPGLQGLWVREYHRAMIRLSERALDAWSPADRTTSAMTVTVPASMIADVLDKVDRYRRELFQELMEQQAGKPDTDGIVMQINFQAFPLMEPQRGQT